MKKKKNKMKYSKTRSVKDPQRGHLYDAGIDFFVPWDEPDLTIAPGRACFINSGVKVNVPKEHALVAFNKSGVASNKKLITGACVVDHGYQGEVHINLINTGTENQIIKPGDKIVQFVLIKLGDPTVEAVPEHALFASVSDRGTGGFGSTGND